MRSRVVPIQCVAPSWPVGVSACSDCYAVAQLKPTGRARGPGMVNETGPSRVALSGR